MDERISDYRGYPIQSSAILYTSSDEIINIQGSSSFIWAALTIGICFLQ